MSEAPQTREAEVRQSGGPTEAPEDVLRANTYSLLAHLLAAPPVENSLSLLSRIDAQESESGDLLGAAWQMLRQAAERSDTAELDDEYHDLFTGMGRGELMPFGSWYMTGFLMEQPLAKLRGDLRELGFERQEGVTEPEDHAAALCEVMSMITTADLAAQGQFFQRHIATWMPRFFRDMQEASSARFYRAVGQLGEQFMEVEKEYLRFWEPTEPANAGERQN
ncbi:MAG: molecular chaperone TorD family protein [Chromatiales bacterium]|nr:molecular chaperone TorD family protein [Chromatiales bacterium]